MPHRPAGWRIEPPVSVPSASGASPAATAAAEPPLEPPGMRSRSHGLRVTWKALFSVDEPIANSSMLVLPIRTASACLQPRDDVGVVGRHEVREDLAAAGGRLAAVQSTSLTATGNAGELAERFAGLALGIDGAGLVKGGRLHRRAETP